MTTHRLDRYGWQIVSIIAATAVFTILAARFPPSGWNVIWMIVFPLVVGLGANRGADREAFMAMALIGVALLTTLVVGALLGGY